jgi:hypothetical protein
MESFIGLGLVVGVVVLGFPLYSFIFIYQEWKMEEESYLASFSFSWHRLLRRTLHRPVLYSAFLENELYSVQEIAAKNNVINMKLKINYTKHVLLFCCLFVSKQSFSQNNDLNIFRIHSSHTSFPDTARVNGHMYNNVLYDAATHYMDSSVLLIAPKKLNAHKKVDLVFWFHGWGNNIDTAASHFELIKQFAASGLNAILILAETTKDAPDSYGGKLEYNNTFKELVTDIMHELKKEKAVSENCAAGNILLAGHSGAYRVMSFILANGNMPVQEVILFDALYAQTDKFLNWIRSDNSHRFIDIYTDSGGTDNESKEMQRELVKANISSSAMEEKELTAQTVLTQHILFIHSLHKHNDIINNPDNFQLFLENTTFLKKIK